MSGTDDQARIIGLPKILDSRGNLSIIEEQNQIPFRIARCYWIYDVPGGEVRGGHAYRDNQEFIVALSGSFDVVLDKGGGQEVFSLNRSYYGLYVPKGYWRQMKNFSTNSVALILASIPYSPDDYIRDYDLFIRMRQEGVWKPDAFKVPSAESPLLSTVSPADASYRRSTVFDASLIQLPRIGSRSGNITPIEGEGNLPFDIRRVFYSYDIPGGESRGAHAHRHCHQFLVSAGGAYEVLLDDGQNKRTVLLNRPFYGLHIPPGIWASEQGFSSGSICLVLASEPYDSDDYIRDYDSFLQYKTPF